jgi:surface carbohydrate biosynthesis protein
VVNHLLKNGSAIMFLHDEGGIYRVKPWTKKLLITHHQAQELLKTYRLHDTNVNRVCVWGMRQKEVLDSYAEEFSDNIKVTGSPRFDLCLPGFSWLTASKAEEKRSRYGPFILICTRFGGAVSGHSQARPFKDLSRQTADQTATTDLRFASWQQEMRDFADFVVLIKEIASSYPRYTIILRPHPSENMRFYAVAFASFRNVVVTREDNVLPWIRSAELVVHSNCTTGVESVLAGRPVLNLLPASKARADFDVEVAREAGCIAQSVDEALGRTEELLAGNAPRHVWSAYAQTILHNLTHQTLPILLTETMQVIQEGRITSSSIELPKPGLSDAVRRFIRKSVASSDEKPPTTFLAKRVPLDPDYVGMLLEACRSNRIGKGRVRHLTKEYVVVDPA